ncbi:MAG: hypothetical protein BWK76_15925 [Desulfobulbaceae bacterium A2]|nr:MAG: hypothetical protein BWK76_15925 [Desulfobulbaceae bacterium A2]
MDIFWTWFAPPLLGAFIGYLTNSIAIRMLFRPLRPWRVFGLRLPMTPGVIPSRRKQLARNIGEMVGAHLLTAEDIGAAMSGEPFQDHLRNLIAMRLRVLCSRDFGSLTELVPPELRGYFLSFVQLARHRLGSEMVHLVQGQGFAEALTETVRAQVDALFARETGALLPLEDRRAGYAFFEGMLERLLVSERLESWLADSLRERAGELVARGATLEELLPDELRRSLPELVERHTPQLLNRLAALLAEPAMRERLISGLRAGIERFLASLGPLGAMAGSFLSAGTIEAKLRDYLAGNEGEVVVWLRQPEVQQRLAGVLLEQAESWLRTPLAELLGPEPDRRLQSISQALAVRIMALVRSAGVRDTLAAMLRDNLEAWLEQGRRTVGATLFDLLRPETVRGLRQGFVGEVLNLLRSRELLRQLDSLAASMVQQLVQQPLGMLDRLVPTPLRERLAEYLVQSANRILLAEVPGLLDTIDIRSLVRSRVDSLDLLRLERLLLSIMEEQFRAINLFGCVLGFIIGCVNLLVLLWR